MPLQPRSLPEKGELHPRNKHRGPYNFKELINSSKGLNEYVISNAHGNLSVNFKDPDAVRALNKALLQHFYGINLWDIPEGYLCPPIPGRADYIHYLADLLKDREGKISKGKSTRILDIGVGANCIYPLIGHKEYGWTFIGSETDQLAIRSAKNIIEANGLLKVISVRKQSSTEHIFEGIIHHGERFTATICNPPFHASIKDATAGTERKWKNLGQDNLRASLNFGGKDSELWCEGGELQFVSKMIAESLRFAANVGWFTTLISKKETLPVCYHELKKAGAADIRTINMLQGQKISRILAWTFKLADRIL